METKQSYANHKRFHPLYHMFFTLLTAGLFICAVIELVKAIQTGDNRFPAVLFLLVSIMFIVVLLLIRAYPLKAQDRAIRAEENLRHYVLTHKLLDPRLSLQQIVALRFASDAEFPSLCQKAITERLSPDAIKKSIKNWRSDNYRI